MCGGVECGGDVVNGHVVEYDSRTIDELRYVKTKLDLVAGYAI